MVPAPAARSRVAESGARRLRVLRPMPNSRVRSSANTTDCTDCAGSADGELITVRRDAQRVWVLQTGHEPIDREAGQDVQCPPDRSRHDRRRAIRPCRAIGRRHRVKSHDTTGASTGDIPGADPSADAAIAFGNSGKPAVSQRSTRAAGMRGLRGLPSGGPPSNGTLASG